LLKTRAKVRFNSIITKGLPVYLPIDGYKIANKESNRCLILQAFFLFLFLIAFINLRKQIQIE